MVNICFLALSPDFLISIRLVSVLIAQFIQKSLIIISTIPLIKIQSEKTQYFMTTATITTLSADLVNEMKCNGVWQESCPISLDRLSLINISYIDFAGNEHQDGEMITLDVVATLCF
jgi:hypothetical protein